MSAQPKSFYLPPILDNWPWKRAFNPHYEEVKRESDAWMYSFNAFNPKSQYAFDKGEFALVGALAYPNARKEHLRTGCDLMHLFFVIDEYTDVEPQPIVREMIDIVIDAMRNPQKPRPEGEILVGEMARQFTEQVIRSSTPIAARHMIEVFIDWVESVVVQAGDRDKDMFHTTASYYQNRRENIGTRPSFAVYELGLNLPDEVINHPSIVALWQLGADMTIYLNDLHSYNKEQAVGDDRNNLVTLAMREFNMNLQEAVNWMSDRFLEAANNFLEGVKNVPSFGPELDPQVKEYIDGLGNWVRSIDCWDFECGRYFGNRGIEFQKTRQVMLLPKVSTPYSQNVSAKREKVVIPLVEALEASA